VVFVSVVLFCGVGFGRVHAGSVAERRPSWSPSADAAWTGLSAWDSAGLAVAVAGDTGADGYADVLVGAPGLDDGGTDAGGHLPRARYQSTDIRPPRRCDGPSRRRSGRRPCSWSVAAGGDLDADGFADLLIGAPGAGSEAGACYVVRGSGALGSISLASTDAALSGAARGDAAGYSCAGAGDLDRDGYGDLLVGAPGSDDGGSAAGAALVVFGIGG
jgi:hypothetical protein